MRWLAGSALGIAVAAGMATPGAAQVKSNLILGATASTSSHYAASIGMAKAIKETYPAVSVTVLETGASVDNIRRMTRNEVDFGLVGSDVAVLAINGQGQFEGRAVPDLVALYAYDNAALNIAVRADSGVNSLADLSGKKFNPGNRGSAAESLTRQSFDLLNIKPDWSPGSLKDAVEGVQNRQLVGYSKYGVGTTLDATLRELMVSTNMKVLGYTAAQEKLVLSNIKGIVFVTLPENLLPNNPAVRVPAIQGLFMARQSGMNDDTAFAIARSIYEKQQYIIEAFPHLKDKFDFKVEALRTEGIGIKLHPGAKKFWESLPATTKSSS
ncbi:MAG: TAXI family TRAP transporter solute-binding subunit [Alphaproteobacteria bacterium]